jgi:hypothetical protein
MSAVDSQGKEPSMGDGRWGFSRLTLYQRCDLKRNRMLPGIKKCELHNLTLLLLTLEHVILMPSCVHYIAASDIAMSQFYIIVCFFVIYFSNCLIFWSLGRGSIAQLRFYSIYFSPPFTISCSMEISMKCIFVVDSEGKSQPIFLNELLTSYFSSSVKYFLRFSNIMYPITNFS